MEVNKHTIVFTLAAVASACVLLSGFFQDRKVDAVELLGIENLGGLGSGIQGQVGWRNEVALVPAVPQLRLRNRLGQSLVDRGIPWASPVTQGYGGETVMGFPYIEDQAQTGDVLETMNEETKSTEARYPYVKYYGQGRPNPFHANTAELDPGFYNYNDWELTGEFDDTLEDYSSYLDV